MTDETSTLQAYLCNFDVLMQAPIYDLPQAEKEAVLLPVVKSLNAHHGQYCETYRNITRETNDGFAELQGAPYLAVRLFKQLPLKSVAKEQVFKVLQSSGTTSQTPATLYLDRETSARQSKVLVKIMQQTLGRQRLPMLIIDSPSVLANKAQYSARGAGIQGMAFFGRNMTYALDENMQPNFPVINDFIERHSGQPMLIFGFTYMIWQYLIQTLIENHIVIDLNQATLIHSGGWKKLEEQKVGNDEFKSMLKEATDISRCFNFYGMAEQVGSVFVECEHGQLHAPVFADIIVRDPFTFKPCRVGETGLIQAISALPTSYPGHSILTEDLGTIEGIDDCPCGRKGKYFSVQGRLPKTEVRGCSDTFSAN